MEYTKDEKCFIVGVALGLIKKGHRADVGRLMNKHPDIFKDIISEIVAGGITDDYKIRDSILELGEELGCRKELVYD